MRGIPAGHPLLERVVVDAAADHPGWLAARPYSIGASDAAKFARASSIESSYLPGKLTEQARPWNGSAFTENGHAHEPGLMAWAGVAHNTRMFRHPDVPEFTATPDGVEVLPSGVVVLGEAKVKHRLVAGPTPGERRQVVWAQFVLGAAFTKWVVQALHPDTHRPYGEPVLHRLDFDEALLERVLAIAHPVRRGMLAARQFEENR